MKALAIASTIDDMDFLNNVYLQLSDVYYETGKYAIAFENYRKHVEIKDIFHVDQNYLNNYVIFYSIEVLI